MDERTRSTVAAWNRTVAKFETELDDDVARLRAGIVSFTDRDRRHLGDLTRCEVAVQLQCSHGQETLSLAVLGAKRVIGVDISASLLSLAARKADLLALPATWIEADVLALPAALDGIASLVFTGNGALPWVSDLAAWARGVARILRPGGRLYIHEGHPLCWVWDPDAPVHRAASDGRGYFDREPRANADFPAAAVARSTPAGEPVPTAWEYQWTLGDVVTALADAGFVIRLLEEHPEPFWDRFAMPAHELARLPHSYSLVAVRRAGA